MYIDVRAHLFKINTCSDFIDISVYSLIDIGLIKMSLYDDFDVKTRPTDNVSGWSSGIKLLQSQLQLKRATVTQPKRDQTRKASLAPVIDLKSKKDEDDIFSTIHSPIQPKIEPTLPIIPIVSSFASEYDWNVDNEYDPLWPNEYEKIVKEIRDNRDRENEKEEKRRDKRRKSRFNDPDEEVTTTPQALVSPVASGFAGMHLIQILSY